MRQGMMTLRRRVRPSPRRPSLSFSGLGRCPRRRPVRRAPRAAPGGTRRGRGIGGGAADHGRRKDAAGDIGGVHVDVPPPAARPSLSQGQGVVHGGAQRGVLLEQLPVVPGGDGRRRRGPLQKERRRGGTSANKQQLLLSVLLGDEQELLLRSKVELLDKLPSVEEELLLPDKQQLLLVLLLRNEEELLLHSEVKRSWTSCPLLRRNCCSVTSSNCCCTAR